MTDQDEVAGDVRREEAEQRDEAARVDDACNEGERDCGRDREASFRSETGTRR
jgi:hypothetical protein